MVINSIREQYEDAHSIIASPLPSGFGQLYEHGMRHPFKCREWFRGAEAASPGYSGEDAFVATKVVQEVKDMRTAQERMDKRAWLDFVDVRADRVGADVKVKPFSSAAQPASSSLAQPDGEAIPSTCVRSCGVHGSHGKGGSCGNRCHDRTRCRN